MTFFTSMPNSSSNRQFLLNIQTYSKVNQVSQAGLVSYLERRIFDVLQNSYDLKGVVFQSLQIEQRSGDLILNMMENGEFRRFINPSIVLPTKGWQKPLTDWEQNDCKVNGKGEPIDEDGMTRNEYDKNEENLADFGWTEIIWGTSKLNPDTESYVGHSDELVGQLQFR